MSNIWFTSDLHLSHKAEFLWGPRGFKDQHEMNEAIVENWNKVVKPDDDVYNLGDMALTDPEDALKYIKQLNGRHWWIYGNHDTQNKIDYFMDEVPNLHSVGYAWVLKVGKQSIYMSHYPALTANFDDKQFSRHVIALYGHTHQQTNFLLIDNPFLYHVGMDSHNCTPVHIDEILADIRNRWNELGNNTGMLKVADAYGIPNGTGEGGFHAW